MDYVYNSALMIIVLVMVRLLWRHASMHWKRIRRSETTMLIHDEAPVKPELHHTAVAEEKSEKEKKKNKRERM